jgi:integrase
VSDFSLSFGPFRLNPNRRTLARDGKPLRLGSRALDLLIALIERIGAKPPLRPNQVWSIRTRLLIERRTRDLALFNLAIDSKLRGCDVVALRVKDVAPNGYAVDRATVREKKTGRPVKFELTDQTRQAVDDFLKEAGKRPGEYLFTGRRGRDHAMTTRQYARLLADWVASIGLDPRVFGTHSLRPDQGNADLPPYRQSRAALARSHQDRLCPVPDYVPSRSNRSSS